MATPEHVKLNQQEEITALDNAVYTILERLENALVEVQSVNEPTIPTKDVMALLDIILSTSKGEVAEQREYSRTCKYKGDIP